MTASGTCHGCNKVATNFYYTRPRKDEFDSHEGYWHCDDHGPGAITGTNTKGPGTESNAAPPPGRVRMNRAERRASKRSQK